MAEIRNRDKPASTPGGLTKLEQAAIMLTAGLNAAGPYDCLHGEVAVDGVMQARALFDFMEQAKWGEQRQTMDDRLLRAEFCARRLCNALVVLLAGATDSFHTGECLEARAAILAYQESS